MIQRIQSVYLVLVLILLCLMFFLPLASFITTSEMEQYKLFYLGLQSIDNSVILFRVWPLMIILPISTVIVFVSIFLYKKRLFQIKTCIASIIGMLVVAGVLYYSVQTITTKLVANSTIGFAFSFPLISIILLFLAIRGISKDEKLVRSLDRLR